MWSFTHFPLSEMEATESRFIYHSGSSCFIFLNLAVCKWIGGFETNELNVKEKITSEIETTQSFKQTATTNWVFEFLEFSVRVWTWWRNRMTLRCRSTKANKSAQKARKLDCCVLSLEMWGKLIRVRVHTVCSLCTAYNWSSVSDCTLELATVLCLLWYLTLPKAYKKSCCYITLCTGAVLSECTEIEIDTWIRTILTNEV